MYHLLVVMQSSTEKNRSPYSICVSLNLTNVALYFALLCFSSSSVICHHVSLRVLTCTGTINQLYASVVLAAFPHVNAFFSVQARTMRRTVENLTHGVHNREHIDLLRDTGKENARILS